MRCGLQSDAVDLVSWFTQLMRSMTRRLVCNDHIVAMTTPHVQTLGCPVHIMLATDGYILRIGERVAQPVSLLKLKCRRSLKPVHLTLIFNISLSFLHRAQCSHCKRCISYGNAVRRSVCPSVCPSVTRRYCVKTTARSTMQFSPLDSKICLVL